MPIESDVPEAVSIVDAHVDTELLTREKYFNEKLAKQTANQEKNQENALDYLTRKREKDEMSMNERYKQRHHEIDSKEEIKMREIINSFEHKVSKLHQAIATQKANHQSDEMKATHYVQMQEKRRKDAEWALMNPKEAKFHDGVEANQRLELQAQQEVLYQVEISEIEQRLSEKLEHAIYAQNSVMMQHKSIMIGALVGGIVGLLLAPSLPRSQL